MMTCSSLLPVWNEAQCPILSCFGQAFVALKHSQLETAAMELANERAGAEAARSAAEAHFRAVNASVAQDAVAAQRTSDQAQALQRELQVLVAEQASLAAAAEGAAAEADAAGSDASAPPSPSGKASARGETARLDLHVSLNKR